MHIRFDNRNRDRNKQRYLAFFSFYFLFTGRRIIDNFIFFRACDDMMLMDKFKKIDDCENIYMTS